MRWRAALLILVVMVVALIAAGSRQVDADLAAAIQRGDAYRDAYLYTSADYEYRLALDRYPDNSILLLRLCDVSLRRKWIDEAAAFADQAGRADADPIDVAECRARVAESRGQGDRAAQQWSMVTSARPADRDARLHLIEAHIDAHHWITATQIGQAMFAANPDDDNVAYLLGALLILDDAGQARSVLRGPPAAALIAALDEPASRVNRSYRAVAIGRVFLDRGQRALAWRAFLEATASNPNYSDGFAYLGITYDELGDATLAAAFLDRALEINRNSVVALYLRGVYAMRHGQWASARADLERAAQIDPGNAPIAIALGRVLAEQGEYAPAAEHMGKAANLDPNNAEWQLALAELHIGRLIDVNLKGVPAARRAVELAPLDARAHAWLGWGLYLSGDVTQAEAELLIAIRLDPASARARLFLGHLYVNTGRIEDGRTELQRAVDLDPQGEVGARARKLLGSQ